MKLENTSLIEKSLVDRIAQQINPLKKEYKFYVLRVNKDNVSYTGIAHGNFKDLLKPYSGWQERQSIKYAGPPNWAEDLFQNIQKQLIAIQTNSISSPVPLYKLKHEDDVYDLIQDEIIKFNKSYLKNEYVN